MVTCVNNCINRYYTIDDRVKELENACLGRDIFAKGCICLLKRSLKKCSLQLKSFQCFLQHIELPDLKSMLQFLKDQEIIEEELVATRNGTEEDEQVFLRVADSGILLSEDDNDEDDDNYDDDNNADDDYNDDTYESQQSFFYYVD